MKQVLELTKEERDNFGHRPLGMYIITKAVFYKSKFDINSGEIPLIDMTRMIVIEVGRAVKELEVGDIVRLDGAYAKNLKNYGVNIEANKNSLRNVFKQIEGEMTGKKIIPNINETKKRVVEYFCLPESAICMIED